MKKYSFALEDLKDLLIRSGNLDIISTDVSSRIKTEYLISTGQWETYLTWRTLLIKYIQEETAND